MKKELCLVLDNSYMPRSIISSQRAFVIKYKGNAEIIENYPTYFSTPNTDMVYPKPCVIRILKYINLEYKNVPLTKNNVFKRDDNTCVYCGEKDIKKLTIDHVYPKSKGGKDSWDNVVTACNKCNNVKADLTIEEWGREHPNPKRPHYLMLLRNLKKIPENWKKYLFF